MSLDFIHCTELLFFFFRGLLWFSECSLLFPFQRGCKTYNCLVFQAGQPGLDTAFTDIWDIICSPAPSPPPPAATLIRFYSTSLCLLPAFPPSPFAAPSPPLTSSFPDTSRGCRAWAGGIFHTDPLLLHFTPHQIQLCAAQAEPLWILYFNLSIRPGTDSSHTEIPIKNGIWDGGEPQK